MSIGEINMKNKRLKLNRKFWDENEVWEVKNEEVNMKTGEVNIKNEGINFNDEELKVKIAVIRTKNEGKEIKINL